MSGDGRCDFLLTLPARRISPLRTLAYPNQEHFLKFICDCSQKTPYIQVNLRDSDQV